MTSQPRAHHIHSPHRQCALHPPSWKWIRGNSETERASESKDAHPYLQCPSLPQAPTEPCLKSRKQVRSAVIASLVFRSYYCQVHQFTLFCNDNLNKKFKSFECSKYCIVCNAYFKMTICHDKHYIWLWKCITQIVLFAFLHCHNF